MRRLRNCTPAVGGLRAVLGRSSKCKILTLKPQILPFAGYSCHEWDQIPQIRAYSSFLFAFANVYAKTHYGPYPGVLGLSPSMIFPSLNCELLQDRNCIFFAHSRSSTNIFRENKWHIIATVTCLNSQRPFPTYPCNCHIISTLTHSVMLDN